MCYSRGPMALPRGSAVRVPMPGRRQAIPVARSRVADVSQQARRSFCFRFSFRWQVVPYSSLLPRPSGLYDPRFEHDACGVGFVARLSGQPGHDIVAKAVEAVANLSHRGAVAADGKSGDGSGVLTQIPRRLFAREAERLGLGRLDATDLFGVAMCFLPQADLDSDRGESEQIVARAVACAGLRLLGWRDVPIDADQLGAAARATLPRIRQALIAPHDSRRDFDSFENALYLARKSIEREATSAGLMDRGCYVASMSSRTLVY